MNGRISVGQGIAIAGIWLAVGVVAIVSLPFAVLIIPIVVPVGMVWGGVVATRLTLGLTKLQPYENTKTMPYDPVSKDW